MSYLLGPSSEEMVSLEEQILLHEKVGAPGATRASLALYTSADDIDVLVDAYR